MGQIGIQALIKIVMDFFFIFISFQAIKSVRTEKWLNKAYIAEGRILYLFFAIAIGYNVSNFVYDLIISSQNLIFLLK